MDLAAGTEHGSLQLFEVAIEVGQRVFLDALGVGTQAVDVREGRVAPAIGSLECIRQPGQGRIAAVKIC